MPAYRTNDPKGWGGDPSRGAALGRPTINEETPEYTGKVYFSNVYINRGGYDKNGTYFGVGGDPVYWVTNDDGTIDFILRDKSPKALKHAQSLFPKASFLLQKRGRTDWIPL
jgi:hypothetical protein